MSTRFLFSLSLLALSTAWSGAALADVPPPDACTPVSAVGAACNNAGPSNDQPGTCQNGMCPHTGPGPDGGLVTTEYACMICTESSSSSSSGGTTTSGTGTTTSGTGTTTSGTGTTGTGGSTAGSRGTTSSAGSSCAVRAAGREGGATGSLVLIGLAALLADRRSRSRRSRRGALGG